MRQLNTYVGIAGIALYYRIPKAVWCALAVSLAMRVSEDDRARARDTLLAEWRTLYDNGIVPQPPPSIARSRRTIGDDAADRRQR